MSGTTMNPAGETAVPASAAAIVDLINTRPHAVRPDTLDAAALRPFGQDGTEVSPERLELIRTLRSDLLGVVAEQDPTPHWAAFTERTAALAFRLDFSTPGQVGLRQVAGDTVAGRISLDVATLVEADTWSRLRICANEECSWAFYDTTRSRTRRWHSYEMCGNRTNVAAYRARH